MQYLFANLVILGATFIQSVLGFGLGIFAMMFLPYLLASYGEATVLSALVSLISSFLASVFYFRHISWKNLIFPAASCAVFSYLSVKFMSSVSDNIMKIMLGVFLILLSAYLYFFSKKVQIPANWVTGLVAGGLSGILGGLFAMGGPPVVIYYMQSEKSPVSYMGTIQMYFVLTNIINVLVKVQAGYVTRNVLLIWISSILAMGAGVLLGKKLFKKINGEILRKIVYAMMAVCGVINVVTSL